MKQFEGRYPQSYQVIVAGGGPAGIAAAVSAARLGAPIFPRRDLNPPFR